MAQVKDIIVGLEIDVEVNGDSCVIGGTEGQPAYWLYLFSPNSTLSQDQRNRLTNAGWEKYKNGRKWFWRHRFI